MTSSDDADGAEPVPSVDEVAEELYGLDRDEFISRRDELAKAARAAGRRDLASEIAALRKPSVAAWVANQLAREYPDEVEALEDLGGSLRGAQERLEGDALRRLSRQRHELVNALVDRGRRLARDDGVRLGDAAVRELERTITAALSEPDAARVLAEGRLVSSWEPGAGFGESSARTRTRPARPRPERRARRSADTASPDARTPPSEPDHDPEAEAARQAEREAAEQAAEQARDEADRLDAAAEQADRAADEAEAARAAAAEAADALRTQLAGLRERLTAAEDDERRTSDAARAASEARSARRREADDADAAARRAERASAQLA